MPDALTVEVDTTKMQENLQALADVMVGSGMDISNLVRDEARRLGKAIVNFTPPLNSKWGGPRQSGEMAIKSEIYSLFSEASYELIAEVSHDKGFHNIDSYVATRNGLKVELQWANIDPQGAAMDAYHKQFQDRNGKIRRTKASPQGLWKSRVVVPEGMRDPYVKKLQQRVGLMRASIALCASQLGVQFPRWISRHFSSVSSTGISDITGLQNASAPSVVFGSRSKGVGRIRERVQAAVNARSKSIKRRTELMIYGYAKDRAAGMKVQAQAQKAARVLYPVEEAISE